MATRLKIKVGAATLTEADVHAFECAYQVNEIPYLRLTIRDGDVASASFKRANDDNYAPGKAVTVHGGIDDAGHLIFSGTLIETCVFLDAEQLTGLTLTAKGEAVKLLEHPVSFLSNQEIEDKALIEQVATLSAGYKFKDIATLAKNKIKHAQFAAYQQTPWQIIFARMIENGAVFCPSPDGDSLVNLATFKPEAAEPFTLNELHRYTVRIDTQSMIKDISVAAWDIKAQALSAPAKGAAGGFKQWTGADKVLARKALTRIENAPLTKAQLDARANAEANFRQLDSCQGQLTVARQAIKKVAALKLLNHIKVTGTGDKFSDDNLITGIRHRFSSSHWFIDIDLGLPLNKTLYRDPAKKRPMPAVMGVVAKFKAYDKLPNTLPVIIPVFDKAKPLYARLATPFASKGEGFFFPPQEGDEVLVSFVGGDPSYPMIVGACHNATNTPPFPYDEKMEKRGLFVKLKEAQMALLVDAAAKKLSLQVQKDDPVSIALSSTEVVITSKDKQTLTVADGTKFDGEKDVTITTKGAFKVDAGGAAEIKASATEIK